ncbi:MAG: hypothetical protein AAGG46_00825, partial [Planctomycetota bacterium]
TAEPISGFDTIAEGGTPDANDFVAVIDPSVTGSLGAAGAHSVVELSVEEVQGDGASFEVPVLHTFRTSADANGDFAFTPTGLDRGKHYSITAKSIVFDPDDGLERDASSAPNAVKVLLLDPVAPTVVGLTAGAPTSDALGVEFTGSIQRVDGGRLQGVRVALDIARDIDGDDAFEQDYDGEADGYTFTDAEGNFTYVLYGLPDNARVKAKAIVRDWDVVTGQFLEGDFDTATGSAAYQYEGVSEPSPELNESVSDERSALVRAASEARKQVAAELAGDGDLDTDTSTGKDYVTTAMGSAQLLHLGGGGLDGAGSGEVGTVLTINQGSISGGGEWTEGLEPVPSSQTQGELLFFQKQEQSVDQRGVAPVELTPVVEVDGDTIVTTTVTLSNLLYEFSLAVAIAADEASHDDDEVVIVDGVHRVEEHLSYDFVIEQVVTPSGRPELAYTTFYAGSYAVVYDDGVDTLAELDDWIVSNPGASTLDGSTPEQAFDYAETYSVNSWTIYPDQTPNGGVTAVVVDAPSAGAEADYRGGTEGGGTISNGASQGSVTEEITVSSEEIVVSVSTPEVTEYEAGGVYAVGGGGGDETTTTIATTEETRTETTVYEATLTTIVTYLDNGGVRTDFDLDEFVSVDTHVIGSGSRTWGDSSGGGDYENLWWDYEVTSFGQYTGGASGTHVDVPADASGGTPTDAYESIDATVFGNVIGNSSGEAGSGMSFRRTSISNDPDAEAAGFQEGEGSSTLEFGSSGTSGGNASVVGVNDDVTTDGNSNWTGGANATIESKSKVQFATPRVATPGAIHTAGTTTSRGEASATSGGGGSSFYTRNPDGTETTGDSSSDGDSSSKSGAEVRGKLTRFAPPDEIGGAAAAYTVPFKNNSVTENSGDASITVGVKPIGSAADLDDPNTTVLYTADIEGGSQTFTKTTEYVGLKDDQIKDGYRLTTTYRLRDETEDYDVGNEPGQPGATGEFTDRLRELQQITTEAEGENSGTRKDGVEWEEAWKSYDYASTLTDQDIDGNFTENADGESPARTATGNLTQRTESNSNGWTTTDVTESKTDNTSDDNYYTVTGTHHERVDRSGSSSSDGTGHVRLANDVVIESLLETDFDMRSDVTIEQNGSGTTKRRTTVEAQGEERGSKTESESNWAYDRTIKGYTEVPDKQGHITQITTPEGTSTRTTVEGAKTGGDHTINKDSDEGKITVHTVEAGDGYENKSVTTYDRQGSGSGKHNATLDGETFASTIPGDRSKIGSSHKVVSHNESDSETDLTWDTTYTTPTYKEVTDGHQRPGVETSEDFEGTVTVPAVGGQTTRDGKLTTETKDKTFVDTKIT